MVPSVSPFLVLPQPGDLARHRRAVGHRPIDVAIMLDVHLDTVLAWEDGQRPCSPALFSRYLLLTDQHPTLRLHRDPDRPSVPRVVDPDQQA
ncbi:MAG: hypothetical protein RL456_2911 [Pseudomonadota bacterium]|jgi:hypothetical protein